MTAAFSYFRSSIGRKFLMAVTGLMLVGFIIAHLLGNLQIFAGREALNSYAEFLKNLGPGLWFARGGLLAVVLAHFWIGLSLARENERARPRDYVREETVQASLASRTMRETGIVIAIFVVMHLLHFTFGKLQPELFDVFDTKNRHDVYSIVVGGFQNGWYTASYVLALLLLGLHLSHALGSFLQTLGLVCSRKVYVWARQVAVAVATLITIGYVSIPLSIYWGLVTL